MAEVIHVDYQVIDESVSSLATITEALTDARGARQTVGPACGHTGLARALETFTGNWDHHRGQLVKDLTTLRTALVEARRDFEQADTQLGRSITF